MLNIKAAQAAYKKKTGHSISLETLGEVVTIENVIPATSKLWLHYWGRGKQLHRVDWAIIYELHSFTSVSYSDLLCVAHTEPPKSLVVELRVLLSIVKSWKEHTLVEAIKINCDIYEVSPAFIFKMEEGGES